MRMRTGGRPYVLLCLGTAVVAAWAAPPPGRSSSAPSPALCPATLAGAWTGMLDADRLFGLHVRVAKAGDRVVVETASGVQEIRPWRDADRLRFQLAGNPIAFDLRRSGDGAALGGFIRHASQLVHVQLPRSADGSWEGSWNPLGAAPGSARLDLYFDEEEGAGTGGYFFFRDPRLPSLYGSGVTCDEGRLQLRELNLGMRFAGPAALTADGALDLVVSAPGGDVPIVFRRIPEGEVPESPDASLVAPRSGSGGGRGLTADVARAPEAVGDGWATIRPADAGIDPSRIEALVRAVATEELPAVHSVLVARHGRLAVEEYFYGFRRTTQHDLRSASKTLASTLVGLAVREGRLRDAGIPVLPLLPYRSYANWDPRKAEITLRDLLTMSSGLDADDHDRGSMAAEGAYQSQTAEPDWVKVALDAPMIAEPGAQPLYGSANPMILGGVLSSVVDLPLEWFADRTLFAPLGISDYAWFTLPTGDPYLGGGLQLRPRDLLKLGQMYLDGGTWQGERILPEPWIDASWGNYGRLAPLDLNGHAYGYLWWHHAYEVTVDAGATHTIATLEARGYGGQYLFVVPELDLVAVVTAGNYRNGRTRQSEEILGRFLLPAIR